MLEEDARLKEQGLKIKETTFNQDGPNKLSQSILTLLRPYKEMGSTFTSFNALVGLACAAWNAALVNEPKRGEMVTLIVNTFKDKTDANGLLEFNQFTRELIERKLLLFPNDGRFVTKFEVTETKDNYHVFVISLDKSVTK
jgi:hypothetical protein